MPESAKYTPEHLALEDAIEGDACQKYADAWEAQLAAARRLAEAVTLDGAGRLAGWNEAEFLAALAAWREADGG